jgi:hypothetical protein
MYVFMCVMHGSISINFLTASGLSCSTNMHPTAPHLAVCNNNTLAAVHQQTHSSKNRSMRMLPRPPMQHQFHQTTVRNSSPQTRPTNKQHSSSASCGQHNTAAVHLQAQLVAVKHLLAVLQQMLMQAPLVPSNSRADHCGANAPVRLHM